MKRIILLTVLFLNALCCVKANNIQITNVTTVITGSVVQVQFDLSWENSWRAASTNNWDGAWVFLKFKDNDGTWKHLKFTTANTVIPAGYTATFPFNDSESGIGMMIHRSANGFGNVNLVGVRAGITSYPGIYDIKAFAIEMVYIPQGSFWVGDGETGFNSFGYYMGFTPQVSYQITGLGNTVTIGAVNGTLHDNIDFSANTTLTGFPNGYAAHWMMKYELSQDGWVQFLNCLTYLQQVVHTSTNPVTIGLTANVNHTGRVRVQTAGVNNTTPAVFGNDADGDLVFNEANDGQWNAMGGLNWLDEAAWLDWAGLRPMTELEYEKACRGQFSPQNGEYAWGTNTIASYAYTISNNFQNNSAIPNFSSTEGNANTIVTSDTGVTFGSLRNGIFANSLSTRVSSGAGYYGAMELTGNIIETCVTTANAAGRSYTGRHGNGTLTDSGYANEDFWPGINGNNNPATANGVFGGVTGVTNTVGCIYRGSNFQNSLLNNLIVSQRSNSNVVTANAFGRAAGVGIRGVRDAN